MAGANAVLYGMHASSVIKNIVLQSFCLVVVSKFSWLLMNCDPPLWIWSGHVARKLAQVNTNNHTDKLVEI